MDFDFSAPSQTVSTSSNAREEAVNSSFEFERPCYESPAGIAAGSLAFWVDCDRSGVPNGVDVGSKKLTDAAMFVAAKRAIKNILKNFVRVHGSGGW